MIKTVQQISEELRTLIGDGTADISTDFVIRALNWAFNDIPTIPRLEKLFSRHKQFNLDAKDHYKWSLSDATGFRRILNIPMMNFYTSTGGEPCQLKICHRRVEDFYNKNGLVNLKQPGTPCEYTLETEDDNVWLIMDRPLNIPVITDFIAYGVPKPVSSIDDEVELSALAENLITDTMKIMYLKEAEDYGQAGLITDYIDNKKVQEVQQQLYKQWGVEEPRILGETY